MISKLGVDVSIESMYNLCFVCVYFVSKLICDN